MLACLQPLYILGSDPNVRNRVLGTIHPFFGALKTTLLFILGLRYSLKERNLFNFFLFISGLATNDPPKEHK